MHIASGRHALQRASHGGPPAIRASQRHDKGLAAPKVSHVRSRRTVQLLAWLANADIKAARWDSQRLSLELSIQAHRNCIHFWPLWHL